MSEKQEERRVEPMSEQERQQRAGDDIQHEPDAVDIKQKGDEQTGGLETEETWHRAGGKAPPHQPEKSEKSSEETGRTP